jgi:hypothetical protein
MLPPLYLCNVQDKVLAMIFVQISVLIIMQIKDEGNNKQHEKGFKYTRYCQ